MQRIGEHMLKVILVFTSTALGAVLVACAGNAPRPVAELSRASTLINVATQSGAQQYAAVDIDRARDTLKLANQAADDEQQERAIRLAQQAAADAEVATARAQSATAQRSAEEIKDSIRALQSETQQAVPDSKVQPQS